MNKRTFNETWENKQIGKSIHQNITGGEERESDVRFSSTYFSTPLPILEGDKSVIQHACGSV